MKKIFNFFLLSLLGVITTQAQENLIPNGDFKQGEEGWKLSEFFVESEAGRSYIKTDYVGQYFSSPRALTENLEIAATPGEAYIVTFLAQGLDEASVSGTIKTKKSDGTELYNSAINRFRFEVTEESNGWKKFQHKIEIPNETEIAKITQLGLWLVGSDRSYKKITEISMHREQKIILPPQNFRVSEQNLQQRAVTLLWDAEVNKNYVVEVNGETIRTTEGTINLYNLLPNTEYTATIYTEENEEQKANLSFSTQSYLQPEGERIPFLANIENGRINKQFIYNIVDLPGDKITQIEVKYNGVPAQVEGNTVTLPDFKSGKLELKITQANGEITQISYQNITLQ